MSINNMTPGQKAQITRAKNDPTWGTKSKNMKSSVYNDPHKVHDVLATWVKENGMTVYKVYEYIILDFLLDQKKEGMDSTVFKTHKHMFNNHRKLKTGDLKAELG